MSPLLYSRHSGQIGEEQVGHRSCLRGLQLVAGVSGSSELPAEGPWNSDILRKLHIFKE